MPVFPVQWEKESPTAISKSDVCPYSVLEIRKSIERAHYHHCVDEPPIEFRCPEMILER